MNCLVDTNVLLRLVQHKHVHHVSARSAVLRLRDQGHILQIAPQNCIEFSNVATRPANSNGLGMSIAQAEQQLRITERLFRVLRKTPISITNGDALS